MQSQEGHQQGNCLYLLLSCLPLQPILARLRSPLAFGYLDDLTLGGSPGTVEADVDLIERECLGLGLSMNHEICEPINVDQVLDDQSTLHIFARVDPSAASPAKDEVADLGVPGLPGEAEVA